MGLSSLGTGVALPGDRRTVPTPSGGVVISSRYIPKTSRCLICRVSPGAAQGFQGFPVLLESGYLSANDVHAFLPTWFVSPRGQIAFEKATSKKLVQEFGWRAPEVLRESTSTRR